MAKNDLPVSPGRRARRQQRRQHAIWPPMAMCAALAAILALSIGFGRPVAPTVAASVSTVLLTASVAPTVSAPAATPVTPAASALHPRPSYALSAEDSFDQAYLRYRDGVLAKRNTGKRSADLDVFAQEGLTPRWFGLTAANLPMLRNKLFSGAPTAYTMSLISLIMGYDPPVHPTEDDPASCQAWLQDFESRRSAAADTNGSGGNGSAFVLPAVYEKLEGAGATDVYPQLPAWTDGFEGLTQGDTVTWSQADWLVWLRNRQAIWAAMKDFLQNPITLPWISSTPS